MGKIQQYAFYQGRHMKENVFNIIGYQENKNLNHNKMLLHTQKNVYCQKDNMKHWLGNGANGSIIHCWWESKVNLESNLLLSFFKNLNLPYDLAIPFLGIYPKEIKAYAHKRSHLQMFTEALVIID